MTRLSDIGQALLAARAQRGLTQRELGDLLGVHQQQVARWERDAYARVALSRITHVAEALGVGGLSVSLVETPASAALLAAEEPATYGSGGATAVLDKQVPDSVTPVRDLGEVVARIRSHAGELSARYGVTHIDVFGSFARGEQRPDSDVDLIVEVAEPTLETVFGSERRLAEILGRKTEAGSIRAVNPRVRKSVEEDLVHVWTSE